MDESRNSTLISGLSGGRALDGNNVKYAKLSPGSRASREAFNGFYGEKQALGGERQCLRLK